MRRRLISNVMIMSKLAGPERNTTRTTHCRGCEIVCKLGSLVTEILLDQGLVVQRIDSAVLVVGEEDEEVWLLVVMMVWGAAVAVVVFEREGGASSFGGGGIFGLGGGDLRER
jgi:hypothetical protein